MFRYIKYAFLAVVAIVLVTIAMANRGTVGLTLLPTEVANLLGWNAAYELPLFLVIFAGVVAGLLIGFVWEWLREHRHRAEAAEKTRQVRRLERQVESLKDKASEGQDEVLAILDKAS